MKKFFLTCMVLGLAACHNTPSNKGDNQTSLTSTDTLAIETLCDSSMRKIANTIYPELDSIECQRMAIIDFPAEGDNSALATNVREWIFDELNTSETSPKKALADILQWAAEGEESEVVYERTEIKKVFENDRVVSFLNVGEVMNVGAAHGYHYATGQSFRKTDGKLLGWNIFKTDHEQNVKIQQAITKELCKYFEVKNWNELKELLILSDDLTEVVPLPAAMPLIMGDSLVFDYQPYEIAPYAAGMPSAKIAIADLESELTPSAQRLLMK